MMPLRSTPWKRTNRTLKHPLWVTILLAAAAAVVSLGLGSFSFGPSELWRAFVLQVSGEELDGRLEAVWSVFWQIRLPRVALAVLVGAALAGSGAAAQGLFRNPLADPSLIGVSAGGAMGAVTIIVLGGAWMLRLPVGLQSLLMPAAAFGGSLLMARLVYRLSLRNGALVVADMLLVGIALNAMAAAYIGVMVYLSDYGQLRDFTFWSLGSLAGASWNQVLAVAPFLLLPLWAVTRKASALNALLLGEAEARQLGVDTGRLASVIALAVACAVGASVAVAGVIAFIGLVVPHIVRLWLGPDHRRLLLVSMVAGAAVLLVADLVARTVMAGSELPLGILTAFAGAPFFLYLLKRKSGS